MHTLVIGGTALIAAAYGLARFGYGLFLPHFTESFALGPTVAGAVQAGSFLSYCIAAVLASRISDRPRLVVAFAGATAALGSLGVAASPHPLVFATSVIIAGAGAGFATPGLVTLIERNIVRTRQENAQTIVNSGTGVGLVVAGGLVFATAGQWRAGWAAIAVLTAVATSITLRADRASHRRRTRDHKVPVRLGELSPLARPLVAAALAGASSAAVWTFGRSVMTDATDGETYSVLAWMTLGAFGVLGAAAGRIVQTWNLRVAWALTTATMSAATALLGLMPGSPVPTYISVALFGASYIAMSGVLIVWAVRSLPDRAAEGTVALFIALAVGQTAGSLAFGALLSATSAAPTFVVAGAVGVAALVPAAFHPHSDRHEISASPPALRCAPPAQAAARTPARSPAPGSDFPPGGNPQR
ncbi:MFS transporter [Rhodococcus sp. NPDC047139]|uniref:MFS transporter n=1 Tax=Rhodococcus sp. NPDC047139 TaxID=3155141 RepID=UPI0033EB6FE7